MGHKIPHWKSLTYGKYDPRELSCVSTYDICQEISKSVNLPHKRSFVDLPLVGTVFKSEF